MGHAIYQSVIVSINITLLLSPYQPECIQERQSYQSSCPKSTQQAAGMRGGRYGGRYAWPLPKISFLVIYLFASAILNVRKLGFPFALSF